MIAWQTNEHYCFVDGKIYSKEAEKFDLLIGQFTTFPLDDIRIITYGIKKSC